MVQRAFWRSPDGRVYAELYRRLDGREAISIHVERADGDWSVVRLTRADFESLVSAYEARVQGESR